MGTWETEIDVDLVDDIESVKSQIERLLRVSPDDQELRFAGAVLENHRTLAYYNIQSGSRLDLVITKSRCCGLEIFRGYAGPSSPLLQVVS